MDTKGLLKLLYNVAIDKGISRPLLIGGLPRDKVLGIIKQSIQDIDITTGSQTSLLAKEFYTIIKQFFPAVFKTAQDGHSSVFIGSGKNTIKIDFSSNFLIPNIEAILQKKGISHPSEMQKEIYSRDFNCNTLLMTLDMKHIKDLTNQGLKDIHSKKINTCLSPDLTLKYNPNRIIRVIYLSSKLDFDVNPNIIEWISQNKEYIVKLDKSYLSKNIDKALQHNADRAIWLINKMDLWGYLPITSKLYPYFAKKSISEGL